jgi:hypothetical protein
MKETIKSIIEWHEQTFPDATLEGQRLKFLAEMEEFDTAHFYPERVMELVDMFIVACGVARFDADEAISEFACVRDRMLEKMIRLADFERYIDVKMQKNRKRVFVHSGEGHYQHKAGIED